MTGLGSRKMMNLALLVGGYGAGQGSILLAQTWLIAIGRLDLVAYFGLHFAMATLGVILVDAGSVTILARHVATIEADGRSRPEIWRWYSSITALRLLIAVLIALAISTAWLVELLPGASLAYAVAAAPVFVFWAFNLSGLLDGLKLSGISGATAALPSMASVAGLVMVALLPELEPGYVLGSALSVGYLLAICVQFACVAAAGHRFMPVVPVLSFCRQAAWDGLSYLGATLPGQLYFRLQLQLCHALLGTDATAIFLYLKQIFVGVAQLIGFVRRVEFPVLVEQLRSNSALYLMLKIQRNGTILSVVLSVLMLICGTIIGFTVNGIFGQVGMMAAVLSPMLIANSFSLALNQGLAALGRFRTMMAANMLAVMGGMVTALALVEHVGVAGLFLADAAIELVAIVTILATFVQGKQTRHAQA